jgi:hypothetical protein
VAVIRETESAAAVIDRADTAMLAATPAGRNRTALVVGGLTPQAKPPSARTVRGDRAVARVLAPSGSSKVSRQ